MSINCRGTFSLPQIAIRLHPPDHVTHMCHLRKTARDLEKLLTFLSTAMLTKLQLNPVSEQHGRFYATQNTSIQSGLFFMEEISNPLVTAIDSDILWFLNV